MKINEKTSKVMHAEADGVRFAYRVYGSGGGVPVFKIILVATAPRGGVGVAYIKDVFYNALDKDEDPRLSLFYNDMPIGKEILMRINARSENRVSQTSLKSIKAQIVALVDWSVACVEGFGYLREISHEILVVNGKDDRMFPAENSHILFEHLPNAFLSLYQASGHGVIFLYALRFAREAIAFYKGSQK